MLKTKEFANSKVMVSIFLLFLALVGNLGGEEKQIAQMPSPFPSDRNQILYLQKKNAELTVRVIILEKYRKKANTLQRMVEDLQQQNQDLKAQIQETSSSQAAELEKSNQALQENIKIADKLKEDLQKANLSLQECVRAKSAQPKSSETDWYNEQIQIKNKKIRDLNDKVGDLNQQNYSLNLAKTVAEQQLQEQMAQWRKESDLLKTQLEKETSINKELRQKNSELQTKLKVNVHLPPKYE